MTYCIFSGGYFYQRGLGRQWDVRRQYLTNSTPVETFLTKREAKAYCDKANKALFGHNDKKPSS